METAGLVNRALAGAVPGAVRPAFKHGYRGDLVRGIGVLVDVKFARRSGDDSKCLDGDVAIGEARKVNVASTAAAEQVAAPEQAVGMKVSHGERAMQCLG